MNSVTSQLVHSFNKLDIYGIGFNLRYNQNQVFQSNFGALVTFIIGILILVQLFFSSRDLIQKKNPEVIQSEIYQPNAEIFEMKKDTFNFSVGVQYPSNFTHFIDNSVYEIFVQQVSMQKQFNSTTNQYEQIWSRVEVPMGACKPSNFGLNETSEYFSNLANIKQMYCLDDEDKNIFIQGNYDQDSYGLIRIEFRLCSGKSYCRKPDEITEILTHSYVAIYMSDIIVNPSDLNPYKYIGKDIFWNNSPHITRDVDIYYRNIVMESDEGVLFQEKKKLKATQFSYQTESPSNNSNSKIASNRKIQNFSIHKGRSNPIISDYSKKKARLLFYAKSNFFLTNQFEYVQNIQIIFDEDKYFFAMQLRFEKQKETLYQRKFKKLDRLLAEIGGIAKALIMIGFFITFPFNKLKLNEKLMNELFNFQSETILHQKSRSREESKLHTRETKKVTLPKSEIDEGYTQNDQRKNQFISEFRENINKKKSQYSLEILENQKKENTSYLSQELKEQVSNQHLPNDKTLTNLNGRRLKKSSQAKNFPDIKENRNHIKSFSDEKVQSQYPETQSHLTNYCQEGQFKLTWIQYIRYYLWPWGNFSKVKNQIDETISQVYYHLDIIQIVKTQLEFEKIKSLLFDQDQIKLLQYLPKPSIDLDYFFGQKHNIQQDNQSFQNQKITSIYYKKRISEQQEKSDAIIALNNIINKKAHSLIDIKLIKMIEQNISKQLINDNNELNNLELKDQLANLNSICVNQQEDQLGKYPLSKFEEITPNSAQDLNKVQFSQSDKQKQIRKTFLVPPQIKRSQINSDEEQGDNNFKENSSTNNFVLKFDQQHQNNDSLSLQSGSCVLDQPFQEYRQTRISKDGESNIIPQYMHNLGRSFQKNSSTDQD